MFSRRAQGTIEYMTAVGAIVVISLIVVSLTTGILDGKVDSAAISSTKLAWSGKEISIIDGIAGTNGTALFVLKSNVVDFINITSLEIDNGPPRLIENGAGKNMALNDVYSAQISGITPCTGQGKMYKIKINYTIPNGLTKSVTGEEFYAICYNNLPFLLFTGNAAAGSIPISDGIGNFTTSGTTNTGIIIDNNTMCFGGTTCNASISQTNGNLLISQGIYTPHVGGLLAYWKLNQKVTDSTTNHNNGTPQNGATIDTNGKLSNAANFNGSSSCIYAPYNSKLSVSNLTLNAWVNPESYPGWAEIVGKGNVSFGPYALQLSTSGTGTIRFTYNQQNPWTYFVDSTNTIPLNQWSFVTLTYDGSKARFYINGNLDSEHTLNVALTQTSSGLSIGCDPPGANEFFDGKIDEVNVWNKALTLSEITTLYNSGNGTEVVGDENGLVAAYHMNESTWDLNDETQNSNTATPYGTTTLGIEGVNGTTTISGAYTIVTFTSNATFTPSNAMNVEVLVVGGGGGGGTNAGAGGGAGGLVFKNNYTVSAEEINVVVGAGGTGGGSTDALPAGNGGNSSFGSLIAYGGGGGVRSNGTGANGGSGGGGSATWLGGSATQPSSATGGYGNSGGRGNNNDGAARSGAGGGGAGAAGQNTPSNTLGGYGGVGLKEVTVGGTLYNFATTFGTSYGHAVSGERYFAGGGGGSPHSGSGGVGGYGGGGGGCGHMDKGGNGGSGVVIIRYLTSSGSATITGPDNSLNGENVRYFDGVDDYIDLGNNFNFTRKNSFSVSFWTKTASSNSQMLIGNNNIDHTQKGWSIFSSSGAIYFQINAGTQAGSNELQTYTNTGLISDNNWHFVTVTYNGTSSVNGVKIYIDGSTDLRTGYDYNNLRSTNSSINNTLIGKSSTSTYYLNGSIAELQIYDKELTQEEITTLYGYEGITTTDGAYTIVTFKSGGTFTIPLGLSTASILVVGGGGGGGAGTAGGGGGGGVIYNSSYSVTPGQTIPITIGAGGIGKDYSVTNTGGTNGSNSIFDTLIAVGGGGGGNRDSGEIGLDGGSGGGGGGSDNCTLNTGGSANPVDQGNNGGAGRCGGSYSAGGGGGGAGAVGVASPSNGRGGNGGAGISNSITGTAIYYAGGGGGGSHNGQSTGGLGGGAQGVLPEQIMQWQEHQILVAEGEVEEEVQEL